MRKHIFIKYFSVIIFALTLFGTVPDIFAWHSAEVIILMPNSTHRKISKDSDGRNSTIISSTEYPDIYKYKGEIETGSKEEVHNSTTTLTGNNDMLNGGFPVAYWEYGKNEDTQKPDNAVTYYKTRDFTSAYTSIGKICHLIQDQAVPAHAANIYHGVVIGDTGDNLERAADSNYYPNSASAISIYDATPDEYYQLLQKATREKLSGLEPRVRSCNPANEMVGM